MSDVESDLDGYDWVVDKVGLLGKLVPWSFSNSKHARAFFVRSLQQAAKENSRCTKL
jgi:hypothetical protein